MTMIDDLTLSGGRELEDVLESVETDAQPFLELDESLFLDDLADLDITDAQKRELLEILWSIMSSMVALGFSHDVCGQIFREDDDFPAISYGAVESGSPLKVEKPTDQNKK